MTPPAFLNPKRLEGRIVALFLALLLVVQAASFVLINQSIASNADTSIAQQLDTGERVLLRLLVQDARQREDAARLLEKDHGFRSVLAEGVRGDELRETLRDSLITHGERIRASLVAYTDAHYQLVTATTDQAAPFVALLPRLKARTARGVSEAAGRDGAAQAHLALVNGRAYQMVAVPVGAAGLGGWVLMAFEVDRSVLLEVQRLSRLQPVLLASRDGGPWQPLASVFDVDDTSAIAEQVPRGAREFTLTLGDEHLRGHFVSLLDEPGQRLGVALLQSFDEAVAPYRRLQLTLLALTVLGVFVFAIGSVLTAKRISEPLRVLSESAHRLGAGDYDTPIPRASGDEVGGLSLALEAMRQGIQDRERQVHRLAFWDPVTGLPNREQFSQRLRERLRSSAQPCAILMLDLDRFKHVNDMLGHAFGDRLRRGVGDKLKPFGDEPGDLLARLGGDEFVLLLEGADGVAAAETAWRMQRRFEEAMRIDDQIVDLSASIGIACSPMHGTQAELLLSRAELAMYAAKRQRSGSQVYEPRLDVGSQESLSLLGELRHAVSHQELRLFLQPKTDLASGLVVGAEALVRWQHPQRGLLLPVEFVPFAEQAGYVRHITSWMVAAAARAWRSLRAGGHTLRISVNLSARDLMDPALASGFAALLREHGVPPHALCLEITEGAIMEDPQRAQLTLEQLRRLGFKLSIDDFGTGYSSLAYLKRLAVDELKIDKSFVMGLAGDVDDAKIVRSTIELAHNLSLSVVAEGLESARTWRLLAALGCDQGQGYYIARPMPEAQFAGWIAGWQVPDAVTQQASDSLLAGLD